MTTALEASDDAIAGIRWLVSSGPNSPTTPALGVFRRIRRIRRNLLTLCEKMETIPGIHPLPPKNRRILELRRRRIGKAQVTPAPDARKKCTNTGDSQSEVAETTYVEIDGDHVVIHNFRSRNRMYQRSKLPVVGKPAIPKGSARHERPSKPAFLNLAECSAIAAASASRAFTELLSAFNPKLAEISGDRGCIHHWVNPGDRPRVHRVRPARMRSKRVDREGCR
jgi:hypothetical protein